MKTDCKKLQKLLDNVTKAKSDFNAEVDKIYDELVKMIKDYESFKISDFSISQSDFDGHVNCFLEIKEEGETHAFVKTFECGSIEDIDECIFKALSNFLISYRRAEFGVYQNYVN